LGAERKEFVNLAINEGYRLVSRLWIKYVVVSCFCFMGALVCYLIFVRSGGVRDNTGNQQTALRLREWGFLILDRMEHGEGKYYFSGPLLKTLDKLKLDRPYYSEGTMDELREDFWHQLFIKETTFHDGGYFLRILSVGANGVFEDGKGDDLFLEVTWDGKDNIKARVKYILGNGSTAYLKVPPDR